MEVVKKMPLLRSEDVDSEFAHKLWWADITKTINGEFAIITYAQLFSLVNGVLQAHEVRRYPSSQAYQNEPTAIHVASLKYKAKKNNRAYVEIRDRENENSEITVSDESIIAFLEKYGTIDTSI